MATSFTVASITADIAKLCNVPTFTTTTNTTAAQVTYWLVQSARAISALYRQKCGADLDYLVTAQLTTVPGFSLVSLPADCGEVHSVLWAKTANDYRLLESAGVDDLETTVDTVTEDWDQTTPKYRLEGNTVALYPAPLDAQTLVVLYTNHTDLTGATSFVSRLDVDRWLTLDVACKVLMSKQRDYSLFVQEKAMLEANLFSTGRRRDTNAVTTIRDVRNKPWQRLIKDNWRRGV